jgi:hypothetical protein
MVFLIRTHNLVRSDSKNSVQKIQTQFITISILSQLFEYGSAPPLLALPYQGKDIVFRFIIEYSSLMDFGACVISLFLLRIFEKMIFWLVLKLEISYKVIIS